MHIVTIAWVFVVVLMALVEATSPQGTVLGALFTLLLYGALPLAIVLYLLGTPGRRRARLREQARAESAEMAQAAEVPVTAEAAALPSGPAGDGRGHAAGGAVAPVREEP